MTDDVKLVVIEELTRQCDSNKTTLIIDVDTTMAQLDLDSLAVIELVYELEEKLDLTLDASMLSHLDSVGDLIAAINRCRKIVA